MLKCILSRRKMFFRITKFNLLLILIIVSIFFILLRPVFVRLMSDSSFWQGSQKYTGSKKLPWYFTDGTEWPNENNFLSVWTSELGSDRIHEQLMTTTATKNPAVKTVYVNQRQFDVPLGSSAFEGCPVKRCSVTHTRHKADAVLFRDKVDISRANFPQDQIWILYVLESPVYSGYVNSDQPTINWTATYRTDSEIVTPYEKWMYYDEEVQENPNPTINYAKGKTRSVAWFVSNCLANNGRLEYAKELQKYIDVDIYGNCGTLTCGRSRDNCNQLLRKKYKFYLAFENSNCRDYITEKFFNNALRNDVVPVVMGAHPDDYKRVAPKHSFIHVDNFPSARDLADYLSFLSANDDLYNDYFAWKGTGEFINTRFFCRLCALLHSPPSPYSYVYNDFRTWWAGEDVCRTDGWTK